MKTAMRKLSTVLAAVTVLTSLFAARLLAKQNEIDVRLLRKEFAIAHVNWELLRDDRAQNPRRGVFIFVFTRQKVGWMIAAAQNSEINRAVK